MTDNSTAGRVAIVTGGSSGIGREAAVRLSRDGFAVVIGYSGSQERAEHAVQEVVADGGRAIAVQADVADETAVTALFDRAEQEFGGVDVVVNAAGIMPLAPLAELDLEVFDQIVRTNLRGTFVIDQQAVRRVRSGGAIVNISSSLTLLARPGYSAYAASKGGVEAVTLILARELRGRDITVNAVAPGPTATPLFLDGKPQELIDRIAAEPPLERLGQPSDIAEIIAFLAGPARWINGQVIYANGGSAA
ncbi:SDR family oxidoreductase [Kribbella sandramycini]|uniref:3-oxoacyl-[acyl-carrier protein] reductase n=1 Tax=Kribbella sandramycini TaxID=60450 RepID=A0A7Y4L4N2_9ACTN|nr:SDR family oxidoreductase [Kribbella sandramycini]MBB6566207.1 3-oxoacyl-[acyl-carrier protein] reductase [Kribbella sandramycini]NOL43126.1 SDR family oxidoreductase [Kribbella sandramycini]